MRESRASRERSFITGASTRTIWHETFDLIALVDIFPPGKRLEAQRTNLKDIREVRSAKNKRGGNMNTCVS